MNALAICLCLRDFHFYRYLHFGRKAFDLKKVVDLHSRALELEAKQSL